MHIIVTVPPTSKAEGSPGCPFILLPCHHDQIFYVSSPVSHTHTLSLSALPPSRLSDAGVLLLFLTPPAQNLWVVGLLCSLAKGGIPCIFCVLSSSSACHAMPHPTCAHLRSRRGISVPVLARFPLISSLQAQYSPSRISAYEA
jgi:hypothetical protein